MSNWKKWLWPGFFAIFILTVLAGWFLAPKVQIELADLTHKQLTTKGHDWASVKLDGRDLVLTGTAPTQNALSSAITIADNAYDVRVVENRTDLLPEQIPYNLSVELTDKAIILDGFVPDENTSLEIEKLATAASPNRALKNNLTQARGASDNYFKRTQFLFSHIAQLGTGKASLIDEKYTIQGNTSSSQNYQELTDKLSEKLPENLKLISQNITPPPANPYKWSVSKTGDEIRLTGNVPSKNSRQAVLSATKKHNPDYKIDEIMLFANGAPDNFDEAIEYTLALLPLFSEAELALINKQLSVDGRANSIASFDQITSQLTNNLPKGFTVSSQKIVRPTIDPYIWSATLSENALAFSGFFPSKSTKDALLKKAAELFDGKKIDESLKIAEGAPPNHAAATTFVLSIFPELLTGKVDIKNTKILIVGKAAGISQYDRVTQIMSGSIPAGYELDTASNVERPTISPYSWSAALKNNTLEFTGFAPSIAQRDEILSTAKTNLPGTSVVDNMGIAIGAPDNFSKIVEFAIPLLSNMKEGTLNLDNDQISVVANAGSNADFDKLKRALNDDNQPDIKIASQEINQPTVSPFSWSAVLKDENIELSGFVSSEETRAETVKFATSQNPDKTIVDDLTIARGAPDGFIKATEFNVSLLRNMRSGSITMRDNSISVEGIAKGIPEYNKITEAISNNVPDGYKIAKQQLSKPIVSPYTLSATLVDGTVFLAGFVPDLLTREGIINSLTTSSTPLKVEDDTEIAPGGPQNLSASIEYGLARLGELNNGNIAIEDDAITLKGTATSVTSYLSAIDATTKNIPAIIKLTSAQITPALVKPYEISIDKSEGLIAISGYLPNDETRTQILAAAKKSNPLSQITDKTFIATGVPKEVDWGKAGAFTVTQLGQLSTGKARILIDKLNLEGPAKSPLNYRAVVATLDRGLEGGLKEGRIVIGQPIIKPYTWRIERDHITVIMDGYVPTQNLLDENSEIIKSTMGTNVKLTNLQKLGGGAPAEFEAITSIAINIASRLEKSTASIIGSKLTVRGEALSELAAQTINAQVKNALPPGFKGEAFITVRKVEKEEIIKPDICQNLLNNLQKFTVINFDTDKFEILEKSFGLLDRLVFAAQRCPDSRILVEGHTDIVGTDEYNQELSENRAGAVRQYLTSSGVSDLRIDTIGFGKSKPVADNKSEEGKARNRRIEFRVLQ